MWLRVPIAAFLAALLLSTAAAKNNAAALLEQADQAADLYNWIAAKPLYKEAESLFKASGDRKNTFRAHLGYLRGMMDDTSLPELSKYFAKQLQNPLVQNDLKLRLKCLIAKADVDAEIDSTPAQADWEQVLRIAKALGNKKWENRATGEIGFTRYVQGDYASAKANTAAALIGAHKMGDFAAEIRFLAGIGTGLAISGSQDEGLNYLNRSLLLAERHPETGYPYMSVAGKIMALIGKSKFSEATPLIEQQSVQAERDQRSIKWTQARLLAADIAIAEKKPQQAIDILNTTVSNARKNRTRLLTEVYIKLSNLYRERGDYKRAEQAAQAATVMAPGGKDMYLVPELLLTRARLNLAMQKRNEAQILLRRATDNVEGMLSHMARPATRQSLLTIMGKVYTANFQLAAERKNASEAYRIIEQVRGRIISELLFTNPRREDFDRLNSPLEDKIADLKIRLVSSSSPKNRSLLLDQLFYTEIGRWVEQEMSQTPSIVKQLPTVTLKLLQKALKPNEILLEYVLAEPQSYCLAITATSTRIIPLTSKEKLDAQVASLAKAVQKQEDFSRTGRALYDDLIARVGGIEKYQYITIVPDGSLHQLPVDLLMPPDGSYFGLTHTISYTPSAGIEFLLRQRNRAVGQRFLGIGGIPYSPTNVSNKHQMQAASETEFDLSAITTLPGSTEELRTVAATIPHYEANLLLGSAATKTGMRQHNLDEYSIIHYATHALANPKRPDRAAILLRSDPPRSDGFLEFREILGLKLNSQLVVLSACDTAVGRLQGEEGIANLTRAFLIAGSNSVVSTLWSISDTYSLYLMKQFYSHLGAGETKADALRNAKIDLIRKFGSATPALYWAGFILSGDGLTNLEGNPESVTRVAVEQE